MNEICFDLPSVDLGFLYWRFSSLLATKPVSSETRGRLNVEKLTGRRSMTVGEFAKLHANQLNAS